MNLNFPNQHRLFPGSNTLPKRPKSLTDLPPEICYEIFKLAPNELRLTCTQFYIAYNDMYCEKLVSEMGSHALYVIAVHSLPYIVKYVQSFDYWLKTQREIITRHYNLPDYEENIEIRRMLSPTEVVHCKFVKDSWRLVYSLVKNRRLFPEYSDYEVDEPESYLYRNMLRINKTYLVKYNKKIKLSPDIYNLSCGIIVQSAMGLGTMKFQVFDHKSGKELLSYFPPTNIDELVPHEKFVILDIGNFTVKSKEGKDTNGVIEELDEGYEPINQRHTVTKEALTRLNQEEDKMVEIDILMEECGLNLKSGFTICYIDVNAYPSESKKRVIGKDGKPSYSVPDNRWIFWSIDNQEPMAENVVNILLKNVSKSINEGLFFKKPPSFHERVGSFAQSIRRRSSILSRRRKSSVGSFASNRDTSFPRIDSIHLTNANETNNDDTNKEVNDIINSLSNVIPEEELQTVQLDSSELEVVSIQSIDDDIDIRNNINQMRPTTLYDTNNDDGRSNINDNAYLYTDNEDDDENNDEIELDPNMPKDVVSIYSNDGTDYVDIDTYNKEFFNVYNDKGEVITRTIKFLTVIDKREYEAELEESGKDANKVDGNAPLKWKLGTMFNL